MMSEGTPTLKISALPSGVALFATSAPLEEGGCANNGSGWPVPSAGFQNRLGAPSFAETYAIRLPSFVHTGAMSAALSNVRRVSVSLFVSRTQMSLS